MQIHETPCVSVKGKWQVDNSFTDFLTYQLHSPNKIDLPSFNMKFVEVHVCDVDQFLNCEENAEFVVRIEAPDAVFEISDSFAPPAPKNLLFLQFFKRNWFWLLLGVKFSLLGSNRGQVENLMQYLKSAMQVINIFHILFATFLLKIPKLVVRSSLHLERRKFLTSKETGRSQLRIKFRPMKIKLRD